MTLHECLLFPLPVCFGGLGVFRPHCTAKFAFSASRDATQVIVQALHGSRSSEVDHHEEHEGDCTFCLYRFCEAV